MLQSAGPDNSPRPGAGRYFSGLIFPVVEFVFFLVRDPIRTADAFAREIGFPGIGDFQQAATLNTAWFGHMGAVRRGGEAGKSAFGGFQKAHIVGSS